MLSHYIHFRIKMEKKKSLNKICIVETPFQLLCANEYINNYEEWLVILRLSNVARNDSQLLNAAEKLNIKYKNIKIKPKSILELIFGILKVILIIRKIRIKEIFIGSRYSVAQRVILSIFAANKIITGDDGVATLKIKKEELFRNESVYSIFSKLSVESEKNELKKLKSLRAQNEIEVNVIIGQDLVESNIMSEKKYLEMLERFLQKIPNEKVIYIPHRSENLLKLEKIHTKNIEVQKNEMPIELHLIENRLKPKAIYSAFSTALFTLKMIYEDAKLVMLSVNGLEDENIESIAEKLRSEFGYIEEINI